MLGYDAVPADFDVIGDLAYQPLKAKLEDLAGRALRERPDFQAAALGVTAAQSQIHLAKANAKVDVNGTYDFTHTAAQNSASIFVGFDLPIFNRNQGEIARTRHALTQAQEMQHSASDTVMSDVASAYEARKKQRRNRAALHLWISEAGEGFARHQRVCLQAGAASLLDFLDAERSYRSAQLAYRQALASYMTALEQLKQAVGTRNLP